MMPLVVANKANQDVWRDHDQCSTLGQMLIHTIKVPEYGDGDQASANTQESAGDTKNCAQAKV